MLPDPSQWYYEGRCAWCSAVLYIMGGDYAWGHLWKGGDLECLHVLEGHQEEMEGGV